MFELCHCCRWINIHCYITWPCRTNLVLKVRVWIQMTDHFKSSQVWSIVGKPDQYILSSLNDIFMMSSHCLSRISLVIGSPFFRWLFLSHHINQAKFLRSDRFKLHALDLLVICRWLLMPSSRRIPLLLLELGLDKHPSHPWVANLTNRIARYFFRGSRTTNI